MLRGIKSEIVDLYRRAKPSALQASSHINFNLNDLEESSVNSDVSFHADSILGKGQQHRSSTQALDASMHSCPDLSPRKKMSSMGGLLARTGSSRQLPQASLLFSLEDASALQTGAQTNKRPGIQRQRSRRSHTRNPEALVASVHRHLTRSESGDESCDTNTTNSTSRLPKVDKMSLDSIRTSVHEHIPKRSRGSEEGRHKNPGRSRSFEEGHSKSGAPPRVARSSSSRQLDSGSNRSQEGRRGNRPPPRSTSSKAQARTLRHHNSSDEGSPSIRKTVHKLGVDSSSGGRKTINHRRVRVSRQRGAGGQSEAIPRTLQQLFSDDTQKDVDDMKAFILVPDKSFAVQCRHVYEASTTAHEPYYQLQFHGGQPCVEIVTPLVRSTPRASMVTSKAA